MQGAVEIGRKLTVEILLRLILGCSYDSYVVDVRECEKKDGI